MKHALVESAKRVLTRDRHHVESLEEKLARAEIVPTHEISPNVVRMNLQVRIKDLDADRQLDYTLVFPHRTMVILKDVTSCYVLTWRSYACQVR